MTLKDIRDEKNRILAEELGGKTCTEWLVDHLMTAPNWATSWLSRERGRSVEGSRVPLPSSNPLNSLENALFELRKEFFEALFLIWKVPQLSPPSSWRDLAAESAFSILLSYFMSEAQFYA